MNSEVNTVYTSFDNKNYVLVDSIFYENDIYVYLIEVDNPTNYMFAFKDENEHYKITNTKKIDTLISEFNKNTNNLNVNF